MLALITATRNSMRTLPDCFASVESGALPIKQFVIDGASTDGTREYLDQHAKGLDRVVVEDQNGVGLYQALNQGITAAIEDPEVSFIGMLHSDDRLITEKYSKYVEFIERNPADVFFSDIQFHDPSNRVVRVWEAGHFSGFRLRTGWMPPHTSIIVAKSIYRDLGLYDPDYGTAADYEWVVRVLSSTDRNVSYFPQRTLSMLVGGASSESIGARLRANVMDGKVWASQSLMQSIIVRICKPARKLGQFFLR